MRRTSASLLHGEPVMSPYRMTILVPDAPLGVLYLAFAGVYLYGSYLSAGWAKRRYAAATRVRHTARHRRTVTA